MTASSTDTSKLTRRSFLAAASTTLASMGMAPRWPFNPLVALDDEGCKRLATLSAKWGTTIRPLMATRYHRLHHCMWHYVRNQWAMLSPEKQDELKTLNWHTPRGAFKRAKWDAGKPYRGVFWDIDNGSGEDFLFYHRWMIAMVDGVLKKHGAGTIEPFVEDFLPPPNGGGCADDAIPDFVPVFDNPDDPADPIVPKSLQTRVREIKAPRFYWNKMNWWQRDLRDPAYLRSVTLGELGARMEFGLHNQMHIRWSAPPSTGGRLIRDESDFRAKWDRPGYDTLFDEYSAHVGPMFYRIHKWIDNRVEDWAEANGTAVKMTTTPHGFDWFAAGPRVQHPTLWYGAWGFDDHTAADEARRIAVMESVHKILFRKESETAGFARSQQRSGVISLRSMIM